MPSLSVADELEYAELPESAHRVAEASCAARIEAAKDIARLAGYEEGVSDERAGAEYRLWRVRELLEQDPPDVAGALRKLQEYGAL